jgi:sugar phosphate isomerase/epimerase
LPTLGDALFHVHAKDTLLNGPVQPRPSLLENDSLLDMPARSWSYVTLGFGHGEQWWRQFCYRLKMAGYDGWLSIEHEDVHLNALEGLEEWLCCEESCRLWSRTISPGHLMGAPRADSASSPSWTGSTE